MSWYQRPDVSGSWGFWQVNRPTIEKKYWHYPLKKKNGLRDISSVYYPEIGPYDSADPDLCEYHILLAKLCGIDAFVADWYGPKPSEEHPYDNIGFTAMKKIAEELDFKVLICWEDRSMFEPISDNVKTREHAVQGGIEMLKYLEKEWFSSKAYLKIGERPVLTNFAWGSPGDTVNEKWLSAAEWDVVLSTAKIRPVFIHDWHNHRSVNEFRQYDSVMPWGCTYHGRSDTAGQFWADSKNALSQDGRFSFISGTVLPGFDNRGCGGWGTDGAIGMTPRRKGQKFRATWQDIIRHDVRLIQIATWNDLNEGGTIEPVKSVVLHSEYEVKGYGYRELETVAQYVGQLKQINFNKDSLRVPGIIYKLRKTVKTIHESGICTPEQTNELTKQIDEARDYLLEGNINLSWKVIKNTKSNLPKKVIIDPDWIIVPTIIQH